MAIHDCDYCGSNTSSQVFYTGRTRMQYPGGVSKEVTLRTCKACYKKLGLADYGFEKGYPK